MISSYKTLRENAFYRFKERGSEFIGLSFIFQDSDLLKQILEQIRKEYPLATHYCFAYRTGNSGQNFRASDDGEPSGTAGNPILNVIKSKELTNCLVVVIRYYGGSKLGTAGLIACYKNAAEQVLEASGVQTVALVQNFTLTFPYEKTGEMERVCRDCDSQISERIYGEKSIFIGTVPAANAIAFSNSIEKYYEIALLLGNSG